MFTKSIRLTYASTKAILCILFIAMLATVLKPSTKPAGERLALAKLVAASDPVATGSLVRKVR
jgi:NhaP-type Na+/H+ or K+/H+ antiporter